MNQYLESKLKRTQIVKMDDYSGRTSLKEMEIADFYLDPDDREQLVTFVRRTEDAFGKTNLQRIVLFGSAARNAIPDRGYDQHGYNDLDLIVIVTNLPDRDPYLGLEVRQVQDTNALKWEDVDGWYNVKINPSSILHDGQRHGSDLDCTVVTSQQYIAWLGEKRDFTRDIENDGIELYPEVGVWDESEIAYRKVLVTK